MNAIEARYINNQGDCIEEEEEKDTSDDGGNNNDYKKYIVPILIHVFSCGKYYILYRYMYR
jgi:hypothetical protein